MQKKNYGSKSFEGIVDSQTKVLKSVSKTAIDITYDNDTKLSTNIRNVEEQKVQRRKKEKYEICWTVYHKVGDPITGIIELPFAILEGLMGGGPKPGCRDWTKWTPWEDSSKPEYKTVSYEGKIKIHSNTNDFIIIPTLVDATKEGALAELEFKYPYVPQSKCRNISKKSALKAVVTVQANNKSKSLEISYYDISNHLNNLLSKYFNLAEITISDKNSRFPVDNALVTIDMKSGFDIGAYLSKLKLSKLEKEYLSIYLRKQYGGVLPKDNFTVKTDNDGKLMILMPSKSMNIAKKISIRHRQYYYRELAQVKFDRTIMVENGVPNTIFLNDIGSKVRKENVQQTY